MPEILRAMLIIVSAIQALFAIAFLLQWPFVVAVWPFPGTTALTYTVVASMFAAAAASTFWAAASRSYGALAGIALDYITIMAPLSILLFQLSASNSAYLGYGVLCAGAALFGVALFVWSVRFRLPTDPPMPAPVRWSFVLFVAALVIAAVPLILRTPNVIPWNITPELSVLIGYMFLGAATYFAYALLRPGWQSSVGQLLGFLAYDIVLFVPLVARLPVVPPQHQMSLYIYIAVVTYSGLLAIYYLLINERTRLWNARRVASS